MSRALTARLLLAFASTACRQAQGVEQRSSASIELSSTSADVWAFRTSIEAKVARGSARTCNASVNDREQRATLEGAHVRAEITLDAGRNVVFVRCRDARGQELRSNTIELTAKLRDAPRARASARGDDKGNIVLDARESHPREESRAPLVAFRWSHVERSLSQFIETPVGEGVELLTTPPGPGEHEYVVRVRDQNGAEDRAHVLVRLTTDGKVEPIERGLAADLEGAVVYGIVPPLYGEPPLQKVARALDGLRDLGVRVLWLSPLFGTLEGDFGYAVTDPLALRPDYGDDEALRTLIREAHERGLRVLLDLVTNHTSREHRYFIEAERLGRRSHYYSYYQRSASGEAQHYFDWEHLPNLNYDAVEVRNWALAFSRHWVEQFDIDGYRVDAAWGVRQRRADFYSTWSAELRRIKPRLFLLAEASARDPYYLQNGFDAAYDWTSELGHHAWEKVFSEPAGIGERLARALEQTETVSIEASARAFRFLNNNDTGARFITRHGESLTRAATAALLTLPGIPCLYALDELGAEYEPYSEATPTVPERQGYREYHKALIALRSSSRALASGAYVPLPSPRGELFAFLRRGAKPNELAIVAINFSATPIEADLTLPGELSSRRLLLRDALMGTTRRVQAGRLQLRLLPWDVIILLDEEGMTKL